MARDRADGAEPPTATAAPTVAAPQATAGAVLRRHDDGRITFRARRPAALVVPLALITYSAAFIFWLSGDTSLAVVAAIAPLFAMFLTAVVLRPTVELTSDGLVQRQYPFSSLTRWEVIDHFGLTRAGNRLILAYRLRDGIPPPRRQPAAALLRAAEQPYDGGYFADSLRGTPEQIKAIVEEYLADPARRAALPPARRT